MLAKHLAVLTTVLTRSCPKLTCDITTFFDLILTFSLTQKNFHQRLKFQCQNSSVKDSVRTVRTERCDWG